MTANSARDIEQDFARHKQKQAFETVMSSARDVDTYREMINNGDRTASKEDRLEFSVTKS